MVVGKEDGDLRNRRVALMSIVALFVAVSPATAFAAKATKGDPITIYTIGEYEVAGAGSATPRSPVPSRRGPRRSTRPAA